MPDQLGLPDRTGPAPTGAPAVVGVLLAAGAGRRMGTPKALLRRPDGVSWVNAAAGVLAAGGCDPVLVVVGASADAVAADLDPGLGRAVAASGWRDGMSASLRAGLAAAGEQAPAAVAALVGLVDTPGVGAAVVARLIGFGAPEALARAAYAGRPGHPVLLGREHWAAVIATVTGDAGARGYLSGRDVRLVECADLGDGRDLDLPADLPAGMSAGPPAGMPAELPPGCGPAPG